MRVTPSLIHRLFYPQVPLVMSVQFRGRVSAMPVVSYASVSDAPPIIAVSCDPQGHTCKLALKARSFSLSILGREGVDVFARLATVSGAKVKDKLSDAGVEYGGGSKLKVPVIKGAFATLECRLVSKKKAGDHLLMLAQVEAAQSTEAFTDFWDFSKYRPLLYTGWRDGMTEYPGP